LIYIEQIPILKTKKGGTGAYAHRYTLAAQGKRFFTIKKMDKIRMMFYDQKRSEDTSPR